MTDRYKLNKTFSIFYIKINIYIDTLFLLKLSIHGIKHFGRFFFKKKLFFKE